MKAKVTITKQEFSNRFDGVLMNNATVHTILSKETNLGFTTKLVTDQLKTELMESIFAETEEIQESAPIEETKTEIKTEDPIEEPRDELESDGLDDLSDLDELGDLDE